MCDFTLHTIIRPIKGSGFVLRYERKSLAPDIFRPVQSAMNRAAPEKSVYPGRRESNDSESVVIIPGSFHCLSTSLRFMNHFVVKIAFSSSVTAVLRLLRVSPCDYEMLS